MERTHDFSDIEEGPSVFETSDVASEDEIEVVSNTESDVEAVALDLENARERFILNEIDNDAVWDFSGSIDRSLGSSGYKTSERKESRGQKMARIARELEELKIESEKEQTGVEHDSIDQLMQKLQNLMTTTSEKKSTINMNEIFNKVSENIEDGSQLSESKSKFDECMPSTINVNEILSIESRINQLERRIGETNGRSIQNQINDMKRKVNIVYNPEYHLHTVKGELEILNKEMESYLARRRLSQIGGGGASMESTKNSIAESTTSDYKINDVYYKLQELNEFNGALPHLLKRLKSLHHVHSEIGGCVATIGSLDAMLQDMQSEIKKWDESINLVNRNLDQRTQDFATNKNKVDEIVQRIDEKIEKLNLEMNN